jgi:cobalamin synthase
MTRSLGGLTGDTYGALGEMAEVTVVITLLALQRQAALR